MKKSLLLLLAGAGSLLADVTFDPIFGSNMVLQQGAPITVSGTCNKGTAPVTLTFGEQTVQAKVKGDKWQAELAPLSVNAQGQTLKVTQGSDSDTCDNVLVGEVWLASGQSNMLFRMDETGDKNGIAAANNEQLRVFRAEPKIHTNNATYSAAELEMAENGDMFEGHWAVTSPTAITRMSAVGYYFGQDLQKHLGTPVGVINVSLGGSEMMAWMPAKLIKKKYPAFDGDKWLTNPKAGEWLKGRAIKNLGKPKGRHPYQPSYLYETGIAQWTSFPIAGVIWYQGESDAEMNDNKFNGGQLRDLIASWRAAFKKPELPFLMVQLPRINSNEPIRQYWPEFRQVQSKVAATTPGVESVCTIDLGSTNSNVHPPRKLEVGQRLAAMAANKVYGKTDVPCEGPSVGKVTFQGNKAILEMRNADGLKTTDGAAPYCFQLSADGKNFSPAEASIDGTTIVLTSSSVKSPKHVRYAWAPFVEPNLVNAAGLPCEPYGSAGKDKDAKGKK